MLPFLVLTALFALFATRNITALVTASLEDRLQGQLTSAAQYAADATAKRERDHLELMRTISYTEGVGEALSGNDTPALERLILPAAANASAEQVQVFNLYGYSVYGVRNPGDPARRTGIAGHPVPPEWTAVTSVLNRKSDQYGDKFAQVVESPEGPLLLSAGPVWNQRNELVGAVVVATHLETILLDVKRNAFSDVTVFSLNGRPIASTFDLADATEDNNFLRGSEYGSGEGSAASVLGRQFVFLNSELRVRGERLGDVAVALPIDSVSATTQETRLRMSAIFAIIAVGVVVVGWFIARQLTVPLSKLVAAATAVSGGDLSARSNVRTGDEIGVLGVSFDAMAERLEQQHLATIGALASAIDARDPCTAGHSVRVGDLSAELGATMGLPNAAIHHLRVGGLLHDIGKIGVRDTILLKSGTLTPMERRIIEQHPTIGLRILESAQLPREVLEIVGGHHERLDGSGYPLGLSAEEISTFPRITAVADMYDAMTTDRPYRRGLSPQDALRVMLRDAENGLLDPEVVATMRRIARIWEERRASEATQKKAWLESLQAIRGTNLEAA